MEKQLLGVREFANVCNIGERLAKQEVASGRVRSLKIGARRLIPTTEVQAYIARLLTEQTQPVA